MVNLACIKNWYMRTKQRYDIVCVNVDQINVYVHVILHKHMGLSAQFILFLSAF